MPKVPRKSKVTVGDIVYFVPQPILVRSLIGTSSPIAPTGIPVCMDDFEDSPLKWFPSSSNGGKTRRGTIYPYTGGASLEVVSPAVADGTTTAYRHFSSLENKKLGMEFWFTVMETATLPTDIKNINFGIDWYDGVYKIYGRIFFNFLTDKWEYIDAEENTVNLPKQPSLFHWRAYVHAKLTLDFESEKYGWLYVAENTVKLKALSLCRKSGYTSDLGYKPCFLPYFGIATNANVAKVLYVDDVLITNHEEIP